MSFDQRKEEVRKRLADAKGALTDAEFTSFTTILDDYLSKRDDAMEALLAPIENDGTDELNSTYESQFDSQRALLRDTLRGMVSTSPPPSAEALIFRAELAVEDDAFFRSLQPLRLGMLRDEMLGFTKKFDKMAKDLQTSWETTTGSNKSIEDAEKEAAKKVDRVLRDALAQGVPAYAKVPMMLQNIIDSLGNIGKWVNQKIMENLVRQGISEESAKGLTTISDLGTDTFAKAKELGIPAADVSAALPFLLRDPGMVVTDTLKDLPGSLIGGLIGLIIENRKGLAYYLREPYAAAVRQYQEQLPNQGTILVCFSQSRKDTDNFIQKNGMDVARRRLEDIKDSLEEWASRQPGDALQSDAREFAGYVVEALNVRLQQMDDSYRQLFTANSGRFMGPVSDSTVEALLETKIFQDTTDGMVALGFDAVVKDWTDTVMKIKPGLDNAFSQIQGQLAGFSVEIQASVMEHIEEIFTDLRKQAADAEEQLQKDLEDAQNKYKADELRKLFDRKQAAEALKSRG